MKDIITGILQNTYTEDELLALFDERYADDMSGRHNLYEKMATDIVYESKYHSDPIKKPGRIDHANTLNGEYSVFDRGNAGLDLQKFFTSPKQESLLANIALQLDSCFRQQYPNVYPKEVLTKLLYTPAGTLDDTKLQAYLYVEGCTKYFREYLKREDVQSVERKLLHENHFVYRAETTQKLGIIDTQGKIVIEPIYDHISQSGLCSYKFLFSATYFLECSKQGEKQHDLFDAQGKKLFSGYNCYTYLGDGYFQVSDLEEDQIRFQNNTPNQSNSRNTGKHLWGIGKQSKGIIDLSGEVVLPLGSYQNVAIFMEPLPGCTLIQVNTSDILGGKSLGLYAQHTQAFILPPKFTSLSSVPSGILGTTEDIHGKTYAMIYTSAGRPLLKNIYRSLQQYEQGMICGWTEDDRGDLFDASGKLLASYDEIHVCTGEGPETMRGYKKIGEDEEYTRWKVDRYDSAGSLLDTSVEKHQTHHAGIR